MRIMAAAVKPVTVAEISRRLGVPATRLYHHIERLTALGLLEAVGAEQRGRATATTYRAAALDFAGSLPVGDRGAGVGDILSDALRDATAAGADDVRHVGRTVAAVPVDVARRVAALIEEAAEALRRADRDEPDPLMSFTYVLAPLAPTLRIRTAAATDVVHLRRVLYEAVAWNPERTIPPYDVTIAHPELARYHRGWGRRGDLAVLAESSGAVVGGALCRLFTADDHGHGYLDDATPELAIAVRDGQRGTGIGTRLLGALEEEARRAGFSRLSLSVDTDNPARHLYARCGYSTVSADEDGIRMAKDL
jgi:GNAT superfamily N-acetyltransferase/DNA-binding transcriptional ArsR family regulator